MFRERGREREREREKHRRGRETLISCFSHALLLGTEPATQAYALTRNQTGSLAFCGLPPNQLSHTDQGWMNCS